MLRTKRLDDNGVAKLKAKGKRYAVPDPELRGHYVRITPTGVKSFWVVARDPVGKQHWRPIGTPGQMTIEQARTEAARSFAPFAVLRPIASPRLLLSGSSCIAPSSGPGLLWNTSGALSA